MADNDLTPDTEGIDENQGSTDETVSTTSSTEENGQEAKTEEVVEAKTDEEGKFVPYDRFNEVIKERNELKTKLEQDTGKQTEPQVGTPESTEQVDPNVEAIKAQLKALGFVDKQEVDAVLQQKDEDAKVQRQLESLEKTYDGKDGRPKFNKDKVLQFAIDRQILDLETAYKSLNEADLIDWHVKNAKSKPASLKTETSDGSGASNVGTTDDDLKSAIAKGDKSALSAYLKRRVRSAQK